MVEDCDTKRSADAAPSLEPKALPPSVETSTTAEGRPGCIRTSRILLLKGEVV